MCAWIAAKSHRHELPFLHHVSRVPNALIAYCSHGQLAIDLIDVPRFASIMFCTRLRIVAFLYCPNAVNAFSRFATGDASPMETSNFFRALFTNHLATSLHKKCNLNIDVLCVYRNNYTNNYSMPFHLLR